MSVTRVPSGWYPDPVVSGVLRWWDGRAWTAQLVPPEAGRVPGPRLADLVPPRTDVAAVPAAPVDPDGLLALPLRPAPRGRIGSDPDDIVHWLLPTARSGTAVLAGYLGLLSLLFGFLGPLAVAAGILALRHVRRDPSQHGRGRAWFGIVAGTLGSLVTLAVVAGVLGG